MQSPPRVLRCVVHHFAAFDHWPFVVMVKEGRGARK